MQALHGQLNGRHRGRTISMLASLWNKMAAHPVVHIRASLMETVVVVVVRWRGEAPQDRSVVAAAACLLTYPLL